MLFFKKAVDRCHGTCYSVVIKAIKPEKQKGNMMTNFELSDTPSYMDHYVAAMFIPHTEIEKFPKVKERIEAWKELVSRN